MDAQGEDAFPDEMAVEPAVEDIIANALLSIVDEFRQKRRTTDLNFVKAQARFKIVCLEVFSKLTEMEPRLQAAFYLVKGVEAGYIARRDLWKAIDRQTGLSPEDRAFAVGMAAGFMTEFLPRAD